MNSRGIASIEDTLKARNASESFPGSQNADMQLLTLTRVSLFPSLTDEYRPMRAQMRVPMSDFCLSLKK